MDPIEQFRETVSAAITAATAAGAEQVQLHRVVFDLIGVDTAAARDAAEALDQLIDGNDEDDLGTQLVPARDLLRRIAGSWRSR